MKGRYRSSKNVQTLKPPTIPEPRIMQIFIKIPPAGPNGIPTIMFSKKMMKMTTEITNEMMQRTLGMEKPR